jgi:hypothetical protein
MIECQLQRPHFAFKLKIIRLKRPDLISQPTLGRLRSRNSDFQREGFRLLE